MQHLFVQGGNIKRTKRIIIFKPIETLPDATALVCALQKIQMPKANQTEVLVSS